MEKEKSFFQLKHGPSQFEAGIELLKQNLSAEELFEIAKSSTLLREEAVKKLVQKVEEDIRNLHFLKKIREFPGIPKKLMEKIERLLS